MSQTAPAQRRRQPRRKGPPSSRGGGSFCWAPSASSPPRRMFYLRLYNGEDASKIPSPLLGKPAPPFDLAPLAELEENHQPVPGLKQADLLGQ